jgi:hypothetical protein
VAPAYVEWFQTGKTPIGTPFEAYTANPWEDVNAKKVPFVLSPRGLEFVPNQSARGSVQVGTTIWLYFRWPYPGLGQELWNTGLTYNTGDQVLGSDGHTYISLIDGNSGTDPMTAAQTVWVKFPVPYIFSRFVITAAFSDTLITNGQNEKAQLEQSKAYAFLNAEYDKQRLQTGQVEMFSVNVG